MQILKRSLLIALLVKTIAGAGQAFSSPDSLTRIVQAHPDRDSNRNTALLHLSDGIVYTDPGTAMCYADEALQIADSLQWTKGIALAQRQKGNFYYVFSGNATAMALLRSKSLPAGKTGCLSVSRKDKPKIYI